METKFVIEEEGMYKGMKYIVVGQRLGHRCGYVNIGKDNPFYGKGYDELYDLSVHGGITYAAPELLDIKDGTWWIGFDCAHWGDGKDMKLIEILNSPIGYNQIKEMEVMFPSAGVVRTCEYVAEECKQLIDQIIVD